MRSSRGPAGSGGEDSALLTRGNRRFQSWTGTAGMNPVRTKGSVAGTDAFDRVAAFAGTSRIAQGSGQQQEVPYGRRRRSSVSGVVGTPAQRPTPDIPERRLPSGRRSSDASTLTGRAAAAAAASEMAQSVNHHRASTAATPRHRPGNQTPLTPRGGTPRVGTPHSSALRGQSRQEHRNVSWASRDAELNTARKPARVARNGRPNELVPPPEKQKLNRARTSPSPSRQNPKTSPSPSRQNQNPSQNRSMSRQSSGISDGSPRPPSPRQRPASPPRAKKTIHSQVAKHDPLVPQPPGPHDADAGLANPDASHSPHPFEQKLLGW